MTKYSQQGASSRYRSYQFIPYLESQGFVCEVSPLLDDQYLHAKYYKKHLPIVNTLKAYFMRVRQVLKAGHYNLVFIEKETLPYFFALPERFLKWINVPYIVDYDDALFHQYDLSNNKLLYGLFKNKIATVMKLANSVIVGNQYLADYARRAHSKSIYEIPTVVDLTKYPDQQQEDDGSKESVFTIGWIGSPGSVRLLLEFKDILKEVCAQSNAQLKLVGSGEVEMGEVPLKVVPWSEDTEISEIQTFDVGIMPLPDTPWARGKCGFKLIQYMACYIPVVASPVGVNNTIVDHGHNGFLASTKQEWLDCLEYLKSNANTRREYGLAGRQKIENFYSLQVNATEIARVINANCKT